MLYNHITPAQPQPMPSIAAKLQLAYTAIKVAICKKQIDQQSDP